MLRCLFLTALCDSSGLTMAVQERDPCPHRIFDDIGGAFAMGAIGGGVWNMVKGARNSPRGERLLGSVTAIKARAPVMGGAPLPCVRPARARLLRGPSRLFAAALSI